MGLLKLLVVFSCVFSVAGNNCADGGCDNEAASLLQHTKTDDAHVAIADVEAYDHDLDSTRGQQCVDKCKDMGELEKCSINSCAGCGDCGHVPHCNEHCSGGGAKWKDICKKPLCAGCQQCGHLEDKYDDVDENFDLDDDGDHLEPTADLMAQLQHKDTSLIEKNNRSEELMEGNSCEEIGKWEATWGDWFQYSFKYNNGQKGTVWAYYGRWWKCDNDKLWSLRERHLWYQDYYSHEHKNWYMECYRLPGWFSVADGWGYNCRDASTACGCVNDENGMYPYKSDHQHWCNQCGIQTYAPNMYDENKCEGKDVPHWYVFGNAGAAGTMFTIPKFLSAPKCGWDHCTDEQFEKLPAGTIREDQPDARLARNQVLCKSWFPKSTLRR